MTQGYPARFYMGLKHLKKPWYALLLLLTLLLVSPLLVIAASLLQPYSDTWQHLAHTVLKDYVTQSLVLMLGVSVGTFLLGTSTAWLTAMYEFPGRRLLTWALLLPLAIPAYILAYTYTGMLDYTGPLQSGLRTLFGWQVNDYWFPDIRSLGGAIVMLSLVLYPYVYLLSRAAFTAQSGSVLEAGRSLGLGSVRCFTHLAIPAARPALAAGLTLVLMETLADYGTVHYFGVSTFTTGIFRTWFGLGELNTAAQLSTLLLIFIAVLMVVESGSRRRMRFYQGRSLKSGPLRRQALRGRKKYAALALCFLPLFFGFLLPATQLFLWLAQTWQQTLSNDFIGLMRNSFLLAAMAACCCLILAVLLSFSHRMTATLTASNTLLQAAKLGYAVPGTVIAVGVLVPFAALDHFIDANMRTFFGYSTGLLLSGTLVAVIFAYAVRFVPLALQSIDAGYAKLSPNLESAARSLGRSPAQLLKDIHLPLLRRSLWTALLLVFVDVLKELPTTLILRPFNFNTLAVRAYELASDERLTDAAAPALAIVAVGVLPVIAISRIMMRDT